MMYNGFGDNMAQKTNAVRIVEQAGFPCKEAFYEYDEKDLSGMHAAEAIGMEMLKKVGMEARADYYPSQLSGGQQQRVAIARALAPDPEIIYFDEPTSALDPELIGEVLAVIQDLAKEGRTMLIVTHEMNFARNVSNRTIFMEDGKIVEQGESKAFFDHPQNERTRAFLRRVIEHDSGGNE